MATRDYPLVADGKMVVDNLDRVVAFCDDSDDAAAIATRMNARQADLKAKRMAKLEAAAN